MNKIKKGDLVVVIAGRDKGKKGNVISILSNNKLVIEGINTAKKHVKPNPNIGEQGGIVIKTHPVDRSNVMLVDASSDKRCRVGIKTIENNRKVRYFKKTNELVDV